jgi:predicted permease
MRTGARILWHSPGLSLTAIVLITLVVGGNTTLYSIAHSVLTSSAPGVQPEGLVTLGVAVDGRTDDPSNSYASYAVYAAETKTLSHLLVRGVRRFTLGTSSGTYELWGNLTSANFFQTLGVRLSKGRSFSEEENQLNATALVAVISHRLWQNQFQSADDIIGRPIFLSGHAATIIGVGPPGFSGPALGDTADVWLPILTYSRIDASEKLLFNPTARWVEMFGRVAPGNGLAEVKAEFDGISKRLQALYPELLSRFGGEVTQGNMAAVVVPYTATAFAPAARLAGPFLAIFAVVTALTVFVVAANVSNLMLARAVLRQRELAVRQSIGASRGRILRVLIAEGLTISLVAWAAVYILALSVSRLLPVIIGSSALSTRIDFTPDWKVAAFALTLTIGVNIVFTLAPAVHAWRQELLPWLKSGELGVVAGRSRLSSLLVIAQLAFSVVLLAGTGLAYRSLSMIDRPNDLGFNKDKLLLVGINTAESAGSRESNAILLDRFRERLSSIPGIESVSYAFGGRAPFRRLEKVRALNSTTTVLSEYQFVGGGHLRVLGVAPLLGRDLAQNERSQPAKSAVISLTLAETLWQGRSAIGETLLVGSESRPVEVVGVTPNGFFLGPSRGSRPNFVFFSAQQTPEAPGPATLYVRYSGDLDGLRNAIGTALAEIDSKVPMVLFRTMSETLENFTEPVRIVTIILMLFSLGSLIIAAVGQYAAIAFSMKARRRDFGLRMALGASSGQILNSVLREGLTLATIGVAIGFALSLVAGQVARGMLIGVTPTDALTYLGVFSLLGVVSLLASYFPARRAAQIDPAQTLRQE